MKKKILFFMLAVMSAITTVKAEGNDLSAMADAVYVQSLSVPAGSQQTLSVRMKNSIDVQTIQFDLYLPEGLAVVANEDNELMTASKERINKFSYFSSSIQADGALRLLAQATTTNVPTGDGEIATVNVTIGSTMSVGDYPMVVRNIRLVSKENVAKTIGEVSTVITITKPGDGRTVLDENSTTAPSASNGAVDVRVKRTIKANEWSTIVLPFAMAEAQVKEAFGDDVQLADFTGYDVAEEGESIVGITVNFDDVTVIEANHPYIIKVSQSVTEFTVDGVDVVPEDVPCVSFGYETGRRPVVYHPVDFIGTYVADFDFYNDAQRAAIFFSGNKLWYATENTRHMKAFRAYFDFDDILTEVEDGSANIKMFVNMDDATGIETIDHSSLTIDHSYNLAGQRVGKNYKGIVIENGMKIKK